MSKSRRLAIAMGLGVLGYAIGLFGGIGLFYLLSSNQHDRSIEGAMTGAFVVGPLTALAFTLVGLFRR